MDEFHSQSRILYLSAYAGLLQADAIAIIMYKILGGCLLTVAFTIPVMYIVDQVHTGARKWLESKDLNQQVLSEKSVMTFLEK